MDVFGTSALVDGVTALSQSRLHAEMSVRTMKKALEVQEQAALSLIQAASAVTYSATGALQSPAAAGANLDVVA